MALIGATPDRDEVEQIREFFAELEPGEQMRLYVLFTQIMRKCPECEQTDWQDAAPDGSRKAPTAIGATNGNP
jgi:hypothetical protein